MKIINQTLNCIAFDQNSNRKIPFVVVEYALSYENTQDKAILTSL